MLNLSNLVGMGDLTGCMHFWLRTSSYGITDKCNENVDIKTRLVEIVEKEGVDIVVDGHR